MRENNGKNDLHFTSNMRKKEKTWTTYNGKITIRMTFTYGMRTEFVGEKITVRMTFTSPVEWEKRR